MRKRLPWLPSAKWWATISGTLLIPTFVGIATQYGRAGIVSGIVIAVLWTAGIAYFNWPDRYNRTALERTLSALPTYLGFQEGAHVRCAIYVPVSSSGGDWLQSATDYMPVGPKLAGYRLHASKGIVGRAYRQKQTRILILEDAKYSDVKIFQDYMIEHYGFTEAEAAELPKERRAFLASPVRAQGNIVLGVIFMDAVQPEAFHDATLSKRVEALAPFFHELLLLKGG
jgi:hypothetical protein